MARTIKIVIALVLAVVALFGATLYLRYFRNTAPPEITDPLEHFKYGSMGGEVNGLPYALWRVLPRLVPDRMPGGWQSFGFLYEPGRPLPVGLSVRRYGVERIGLNCSVCHTTRIAGRPEIILGAPAEALQLQRYLQLLAELPDHPGFNADAIVTALRADDAGFDFIDELVYRNYVIPKVIAGLRQIRRSSAWMTRRAPHGPGRTDAGNPWRQRFGLNPGGDDLSGATDFPHIWAQRSAARRWAHWDANNGSLDERNLSAALAGGATPESLDHASIRRVAAWTLDAPAPRYPGRIDAAAAMRGQSVYRQSGCGACHDPGGAQFGEATPIAAIGTDRDRFDVFSAELLNRFASVGEGYDWQFRNYRKSSGYANVPLDGIWARGPFLHNGSVPTLDDLFRPASERPRQFYRGCTVLDVGRVGFRCSSGVLLDTSRGGNGNGGHDFGTALGTGDRRDLIEYLKTR